MLLIFIFLGRRLLLVIVVVALKDLNVMVRFSINMAAHLAAVIYAIVTRPFESAKENEELVINNGICLVASAILVVVQNESTRSETLADSLIYLLIMNGVVV